MLNGVLAEWSFLNPLDPADGKPGSSRVYLVDPPAGAVEVAATSAAPTMGRHAPPGHVIGAPRIRWSLASEYYAHCPRSQAGASLRVR